MSRELALIVEAYERSDIARRSAGGEKLLRAEHPQLGEIGVWRDPDLGAEGAAETELVDAGMRGKIVESDPTRRVLAEQLERAAHGATVEARTVERREGRESLRHENIARELRDAARVRCVEQAMERSAARVGCVEHRREAHGPDRVVDESRREGDDSERDGTVAADIAMHVARLAHMKRAGHRIVVAAANVKMRAPPLDATNRVRLLHPGMRLRRGPAKRMDRTGGEERLDHDRHDPSVDRRGRRRSAAGEKGPRIAKPLPGRGRTKEAMIQGKVVVITGASSGIGDATARVLAAAGAKVVLGARRVDRIDRLAAELGGVARATDVTKRADIDALVALALETYGKLDVLVANAGIARIGPLDDLAVDDWLAMIGVNLNGFLYGIAAALPVFRRQGFGHFVTTISVSGLRIVPRQAIYAATKNAVRTVHEGLRQEAGPKLRVSGVSPGYVKTELATASIEHAETRAQIEAQMAKLAIAPEAIARAIAFAIDQPDDVDVGDIVVRPTAQD